MKHDIPHDLEPSLAKTVAQKAAQSYAERFASFDLKHNWVSDTTLELVFSVTGKKLQGSLTVQPDLFRFELQVPMLLQMFSGKAKEIIDRETQVWIDKAKRGELDNDVPPANT